MSKVLNTRIKNRRDTSANWTANNPVLLNGEIALVDTNAGELRAKIGDGVKTYSQLPFSDEVLKSLIDNKVEKVSGKGLSTNDYTTAEKNKLAELETLVGDKTVSSQISAAVDECITGLSVSGKTITYTKGDNSTGTITTQDTTYSAAGSALGLVKSGGDVTISSGVITVNDDSHNHTIANVDNLQTTLDGKAAKETGIFYIEGGGTTDTTNKVATWTGSHEDIKSYYDGLTIAYKIGTAGSTTTTLNINNLGAVAVVRNVTSAISTSYAVNSIVFLTYTTDDSTSYWKTADYDANTRNTVGDYRKNGTKLYFVGTTSSDSSATSSYATSYTNSNIYVNTSNVLYSAEGFSGDLTGTATKATQDASGNVITDTYATKTELNTVSDLVGDTAVSTQINTAIASKSDTGHTHNYAGSSSAGGAATSANKLNSNAGSATQPVYFANGVPVATTYTLNTSVPSGAKFTDTTYSTASTSTDGLMSSTDKTKLNGIATGATKVIVDSALNSTSTNAIQNKVVNAAISNLSDLVGDTSVSEQISQAIASKANTTHSHDAATTSAAGFMSTSDKTKLNGIATGAEVNQNAFSNIKVGSTTISADAETDTLTIAAGNNITLTPDATNDKLTIAATDTVYTHPSYTARTGVPTANATPAFGGTFSVSQPVSDSSGHITAINSRTVTIPSTTATTSAAGLMSADDKTKLNGIATGATKTTVDSALSSSSTNPVQNKVINAAISSLNSLVGSTSVSSQINAAISAIDYPVDSVNGKTGAVTLTASDVSALPITGGTVTGMFTLGNSSSNPWLNFAKKNDGGSVGTMQYYAPSDSASNHYEIYVMSRSSADNSMLSTAEIYKLPVVDADRTSNKTYYILTSKSPVTVAQGGTGATDAAQARENLGITAANLGITAESLGALSSTSIIPVTQGGTGATTASAARSNLGITLENLGIVYSTTQPTYAQGKIWLKPV